MLPNYATSWVPVLPTSPYAIPGPSTEPGTFEYAPLVFVANGSSGTTVVPGNPVTGSGGGVRDQNGVQRNVDPNIPITGAGTSQFYDIERASSTSSTSRPRSPASPPSS